MRLLDLAPRWIPWGGNPRAILVFQCPHCRNTLLTCIAGPMSTSDQFDAWDAAGLDSDRGNIVPSKPTAPWTIQGDDFATLSITPSLDASTSGHWHGYVTAGQIVGGQIKE